MIVIVSHSSFSQDRKPIIGTGAFLSHYFLKKKKDYVYIRFPIFGEQFFHIETAINSDINSKTIDYVFSKNLFFKSIQELFLLSKQLFYLKKINLIISIDPLNTFYSLILKKFFKVKLIIYYTADFAIKRFENAILNKIYHSIDAFCINTADFIWNVSTRITRHRKSQGLKRNKNFFVPNSPIFDKNKILHTSKLKKHSLIIVTTLTNSLDFESIFSSVSVLKNKYKDITLTVIGKGNWKVFFNKLLKKYDIEKNVVFYGPMTHKDLINKIETSRVGIALYTNDNPWTYYCDSMKARDYLSCGIPVIISSITSTSDDISKYEAGFVIDDEFEKNLVKNISRLFENESLYKKYRMNAIRLSKDFDIEKILDKTFSSCRITI